MGTEIFRMCSLGLSLNEILRFLHRAKRYFSSLFSFAVDASVLSVGSVVQLRRAIAGISKTGAQARILPAWPGTFAFA